MDLSNITRARYIKLGSKGQWEEMCVNDGTLRLEYLDIPHKPAKDGNKSELAALFDSKKGADHARQIIDFYHSGNETLWITFHAGQLWWAIASGEVKYVEGDTANGRHIRQTESGWKNTSINGKPLHISSLSGGLTKSAAYQMTICSIQGRAFDYLLRKIKDIPSPEVEACINAKTSLLHSIETLMKGLTAADFELMVDLIFSRSGWQRINSVGGTQKTIDMEYLQPFTQERAVVQVKSSTNQKQLDDYLHKFKTIPSDKQFYAYHSVSPLDTKGLESCTLLGPQQLAKHILNAGLTDWLIEKAA